MACTPWKVEVLIALSRLCRIEKAVDGMPTERYVYDGENILFVFDSAGNLKARYLQGPGMDNTLAEEDVSGSTTWLLPDHQGSIRDVIDNDGTVLDHLTYDSFGNILSQSSTTNEPRYTYTGREWDQDAGMFYYRARWYDAKAGRFLSEDPIGFDGGDGNLTRYVGNDPVRNVDPQGTARMTAQVIPGAAYWEANWTRATFVPGASAGGGSGVGPVTAGNNFVKAVYYKRYRELYYVCDMCDVGYYKWGPVLAITGEAETTDPRYQYPTIIAMISIPIPLAYGKKYNFNITSTTAWGIPVGQIRWPSVPAAPDKNISAAAPINQTYAPENYTLVPVVRCSGGAGAKGIGKSLPGPNIAIPVPTPYI